MFKTTSVAAFAVSLVFFIAFAAQDSPHWTVGPPDSVSPDVLMDESAVKSAMADLHIPFLANQGRVDDRVEFYARTFGGMVFVTADGDIVYNLPCNDQKVLSAGHMAGVARNSDGISSADHRVVGLALREHVINQTTARVRAEGPAIAKISSFKGNNPAKWAGEIPGYAVVDFGEVYDGINLKLRASGNNVEKVFHVSPGARPDNIRVRLTGADRLQVNTEGQLEAHSALGSIAFTKPVAYQDCAGSREFVEVDYRVDGMEYGFALGDYDPQTELVIDPFLASTFLGGSGRDGHFEVPILLDDEGNVYVAGRTLSTDFPVTLGAYEEENVTDDQDVFIAKLTGDLSTLLAATYLGGSSLEGEWPGVAMSLDADGNVYVTGKTRSADFPTTTGAYSGSRNGASDAFIAKLDGDLTTLLASTLLGGSDNEDFVTIEATEGGDVYVVGLTASDDFPFTQTAYDTLYAGGTAGTYHGDLFVSLMDGNLTTLLASTYVGGSNDEYCEDIFLDASGNVYLAGWVSSTNYPTTLGAYRRFHQGGFYDGFVTRLSADLTTLMASTYVGGSAWDFAYALTLDGDGNAYITGHTASTNYPWIPGCYDITYNSDSAQGVGDDAFVTKLNPDLTTLMASTYLGGGGWDDGQALIVDAAGNIIVAGITTSADFPWIAGALDSVYRGNEDIFISRLDNNLQTLSASTYIGASEHEIPGSMALAADGYIYIAGSTNSPNFPATPGAYDEDYNGGGDNWGGGGNRGGDVLIFKVDLDWASKDWDSDGVINIDDNCIYESNPGQEDTDGDGIGDVCDNCSSSNNPEQDDINNNGIGDVCEVPETWYVTADGLGEAPTIQAAIDSCTHGDTVLVADGLYTGVGNELLDFHHRQILLRSENGPRATTIDCQASDTGPRRLFTFENGEDASFVVDGFTIRGGYGPVFNGSSSGGAMLFDNASPTIKNCIFTGNTGVTGGAVYCYESSPDFINCTFAGNTANYGAALFSYNHAAPQLENLIIAFNSGGSVMCLESSSIGLSCCDVFGNTGGDYIDCLSGQNGVDGNFSADPLFCHVGSGDVDLRDGSPCAAENNTCSVLIGAGQVGCTCNCEDYCDVDLSGAINPVDVVYMVNFVYKSQDGREQILSCGGDNGDWNCDGTVNPVDVVYYVNSVYKSQGTGPCDPCACISYPDNCP